MNNLLICYPKCTTCQKAKKWLDEHGMDYYERNIKEQNPTELELRQWVKQNGLPFKRFFNTSGFSYKSLGLSKRLPTMSEDEQLALLASDGMLWSNARFLLRNTECWWVSRNQNGARCHNDRVPR